MSSEHEKECGCVSCGKLFANKQILEVHICPTPPAIEEPLAKSLIICGECTKGFDSIDNYNNHYRHRYDYN